MIWSLYFIIIFISQGILTYFLYRIQIISLKTLCEEGPRVRLTCQRCVGCGGVGGEIFQRMLNTLRLRQNELHIPDDIFKRIFLNDKMYISIQISLKLAYKGLINNIAALVQIMAWCRPGTNPSSKSMAWFTDVYMYRLNELITQCGLSITMCYICSKILTRDDPFNCPLGLVIVCFVSVKKNVCATFTIVMLYAIFNFKQICIVVIFYKSSQ